MSCPDREIKLAMIYAKLELSKRIRLKIYCQKVRSDFPIRCYGKIRTNFLANPIHLCVSRLYRSFWDDRVENKKRRQPRIEP